MASPDIDSILNDTTSGSELLLSKYVAFFGELTASSPPPSTLISLARRALHHHCHFIVIAHFLNELIHSANSTSRLQQTIRRWSHRSESLSCTLYSLYISLWQKPPLPLRILTLSQSGSVQALALALSASGTHVEVVQMRSAPGDEGLIQARALQQKGITTHLIEDREAPSALSHCDEVWLGADLYTQRRFLNKVGSRQLTALALSHGKRVIVVADRAKSLHYSSMPVWVLRCIARKLLESKAPLEWTALSPGVHVLGEIGQ